MCYNSTCGSVYTFTRVGALNARERNIFKYRLLGIALGIGCFLVAVLGSNKLIFKLEVTGSKIYKREAISILNENGMGIFSAYQKGKEEQIVAQILCLDGVEFCSVKKHGNTVRVEIQQSPLPQIQREEGDLIAPRNCRIESVVALCGTMLKKQTEELREGESIVGGFFISSDGITKKPTHVVAKAKLSCIEQISAKTEESAVAQAILFVQSLGGEIKVIRVEEKESGVVATVEFTIIIKKNM